MNIQDIKQHYEWEDKEVTRQLAAMLGVSTQAIYGWRGTIPLLQQLKIEKLTGGALVSDEFVDSLVSKISNMRIGEIHAFGDGTNYGSLRTTVSRVNKTRDGAWSVVSSSKSGSVYVVRIE